MHHTLQIILIIICAFLAVMNYEENKDKTASVLWLSACILNAIALYLNLQ